eukprot:CAMPEP_0204576880 /NCGR_PEP_ID=MMETSP0661-20131031/42028_1 /ASSEMBLY_ACC=CAM_ASM_000606 /TAXON_ID=109239 /ORGANISM="Alexandrium margalefi, Strain AMGDE01CS-322" /LENGTH=56 /DNA_ID=CAMNT_0051585669 /DNA_START=97 /DNA_END=267 /DNA_ORIENTATION=-
MLSEAALAAAGVAERGIGASGGPPGQSGLQAPRAGGRSRARGKLNNVLVFPHQEER